MIAIVDTGGANLASVTNAFERLAQPWVLTTDRRTIEQASHVILPGVGAAKDTMVRLMQQDLCEFLPTLKQPVLGICLGMQILFERSSEGCVRCLAILPGEVARIKVQPTITIPHMGWNQIHYDSSLDFPLLRGIDGGSYFYFIHSYRAPMGPYVRAYTHHGEDMPAIVARDNFLGVQFHPERSGTLGAQLLRNFLAL